MTAMKVIADSLEQWKSVPNTKPPHRTAGLSWVRRQCAIAG